MQETHRLWIEEQRRSIAQTSQKLACLGYVVATSGNISTCNRDLLAITPASRRKDELREDEIVICTREGNPLDAERRPSSEIAMHLAVYRHRTDVTAALHAHPIHTTACQLAGIPLTIAPLPEINTYIGRIASVPYATPGTKDMGDALVPFLRDHNAFILERHGALVLGKTLEEAFNRLEQLEHIATIAYLVAGRKR